MVCEGGRVCVVWCVWEGGCGVVWCVREGGCGVVWCVREGGCGETGKTEGAVREGGREVWSRRGRRVW